MLRILLLGVLALGIMGCGGKRPATVSTAPFVGSAGRAVFHRADCQWARKIKPENRIEYATREDAIADGLRPCGVCRP